MALQELLSGWTKSTLLLCCPGHTRFVYQDEISSKTEISAVKTPRNSFNAKDFRYTQET